MMPSAISVSFTTPSLRSRMVQAKALTMTLAASGRNSVASSSERNGAARARQRERGRIADRERDQRGQQRQPQRIPDHAEIIRRAEQPAVVGEGQPVGADHADAEQQRQRQREHAGQDQKRRQREAERGEPLAIDRAARRPARASATSVMRAPPPETRRSRRPARRGGSRRATRGDRGVAAGQFGEQALAAPASTSTSVREPWNTTERTRPDTALPSAVARRPQLLRPRGDDDRRARLETADRREAADLGLDIDLAVVASRPRCRRSASRGRRS